MDQALSDHRLLPAGLLIVALLLALLGTCAAWAEPPAADRTGKERAERIRKLTAEAARIRSELRQLERQPEGVTRSVAPRSELMEQPTRTMRESLESLPGVTARQGSGGRDATISIRGSGK
ncbi:MAG: Plug domain-containing protein [Nitrospira sp.]|nr:Plug domain-containing protein [Nitrospira sp.]